MSDEVRLLSAILKSDMAQTVIKEFGIEGESEESKAYLIAKLGENILGRIMLEAINNVPNSEHTRYKQLVESGDIQAFQTFILRYIPDFTRFAEQKAREEIARTKSFMRARPVKAALRGVA